MYIYYISKKAVNQHLGRKMDQDVGENKKLFRKEVDKINGGKVESCIRVKYGSGRMLLGGDEV